MNNEDQEPPIAFDKDVPLPKPRYRYKRVFDGMEVGDSFVGGTNEANSLHMWCKRHGWRFTRRALPDEPGKWRFWRTE